MSERERFRQEHPEEYFANANEAIAWLRAHPGRGGTEGLSARELYGRARGAGPQRGPWDEEWERFEQAHEHIRAEDLWR